MSKTTYRFKNGRNCSGYGYYAYISNNGDLVIGEDWGREGGDIFSGSYAKAGTVLVKLEKYSPELYKEIVEYYRKESEFEQLKQDMSFDEETKTILFKVKLFTNCSNTHIVMVRGRFQADVIKKLMPPLHEVLTLQTLAGDIFAIRSDMIYAVEFL